MSLSTRNSYLVQLVLGFNKLLDILFLRFVTKTKFNKTYIFTRFRHVLPDEVAVSLGQGQGGGGQGSACLEKSFHRILWFSFFIFVFEPLVFRLFLLLASVIFIKTYILSRSFMKVNEFHYSFPLILCVLYTEFVFFLFSFQLPHKSEDDKNVFTYAPPSTTVVLLSLLGSSLFELVKSRRAILDVVYPHQPSTTDCEGRTGMPPSYMVVEVAWDLEEGQTENEEINNNTMSKCLRKKSCCSILKPDLLKIHRMLTINKQILVWPLPNLAVMPPSLAVALQPDWIGSLAMVLLVEAKARHPSSCRKEYTAPTENIEEIWRLLTRNLNTFVATSAVRAAAILALKTQHITLKQQNVHGCQITHVPTLFS